MGIVIVVDEDKEVFIRINNMRPDCRLFVKREGEQDYTEELPIAAGNLQPCLVCEIDTTIHILVEPINKEIKYYYQLYAQSNHSLDLEYYGEPQEN